MRQILSVPQDGMTESEKKKETMSKLYLVPDRADMERMCSLAAAYDCAFEYNDFFIPAVMDDFRRQEEIITDYGRYRNAFSGDTMHGAFLDVTIYSDDPLIRDASMQRVRQSMEIAKRMGLKGIVFHTGRISGFRASEYLRNWRDRNVEFFTETALRYPEQQIYMENMFDEAPDILAEMAEKMQGITNFGVCLDYAHAVLSDCPGSEWIETLAPYIRHMHINDNDLKNDLHLAVGTGRLDWQEFDRLIRQYRINTPVLVEVNGYETQKESLEYMKRHGIYPMEKEGEK